MLGGGGGDNFGMGRSFVSFHFPLVSEQKVVSVCEKRGYIHALWVTYSVVVLSEWFVMVGSVLSAAE